MISYPLSPHLESLLPTHAFRAAAVGLLVAVLAIGCGDDIDSRLTEAMALQEAGKLELSIIALEKILREDPKNDETNFLLGSALVQSDRQKRAIPHLENAAASSRYAIPAGLLLASTQYRVRAYDDAIRTCEHLLEIDPDNLTAVYASGLSYLASGQPARALDQANRILETKSRDQNAVLMQAKALVALGRAEEAETIWTELRQWTTAEASPNAAARACGELARLYQLQGELDRAEALYGECLSEYPAHVYLQKIASDFFVQRSQPERAIEIHRQAVATSPGNIQVWSRLAAAMYLHADLKETHETYLEIVEHFDSPEAWRLLADFHRKTRHTTAARKAIEEALIRSEEPPEAFLYSLAELLVDEGNIDRARKIGQRLETPSYRRLLAGAISLKMGSPQQALEQLDAGLRLWPNNPNARYLVGQAAFALHQRKRAIAAFEAAILVGGGTTDAALRLAEIHFWDGNYASARGFAKHQIAKRPYLDTSPYHIAIRSALKLDRLDDAKEILKALREMDPNDLAVTIEMIAIERFDGGAKASSRLILASGHDLTDPANERILRALADDLNSLGRGEEALGYVDLALERENESAALHDLRARILSQLGRVDEATASTKRALSIDPGFAPALEMKAYSARQAGDLTTALAALDAASEAEPMEAKYLYAGALLARDLGDTDGSIARIEATLLRRPMHGLAANDLAWIFANDRRNLDRALVLAEIAIRHSRSNRTLMTLGWVHHQRAEYDEAISNYRLALEADNRLPAVRYRLALALAESGNIGEARKVLDELIQGPAFPDLEAARIELARLEEP